MTAEPDISTAGDVDRPRHQPIRLVAIDLDGTLLDRDKRVSEQTVRALKCLPAAGVKVVIASARPPRSVRHIYHQLALDTWQINYNGALIWDEPTRRRIFHRPMDGALVLHDPRFNANLALIGGRDYVKVFPRSGQMLIFPASVWHSVTPQQVDARRLSVAANFRVEPRDKPPRSTFPLRVEG